MGFLTRTPEIKAFIVGQQFASCRRADPIQDNCESSPIVIKITQRRKKNDQLLGLPGLCDIFSLFGGCVAGICCHPLSGEDHASADGRRKKKMLGVSLLQHGSPAPPPPLSHSPLTLRSGFPQESRLLLFPPTRSAKLGDFLLGKIQHRDFHYWPVCRM
ncbi:hypothetical protein EDB85DRAFT_1138262 [Lactarius pseudohatsudake]|nr:hypothetical protein EDB85DRAFT_1138262 [Lactarius pseudohatsudake]